MLTWKFVAKAGVVIGSGLFGSKLFSAVSKNGLGKLILGYAGAAVGGFLGLAVATGLDQEITAALKKVDEGEKNGKGEHGL
jgi:hypothetical protein